jgi:hypothetical protein
MGEWKVYEEKRGVDGRMTGSMVLRVVGGGELGTRRWRSEGIFGFKRK